MNNIYVGDIVKVKPTDGSTDYEGKVALHPLADLCVLNPHGFPIKIHKNSNLELVQEGAYHGVGKSVEQYLLEELNV